MDETLSTTTPSISVGFDILTPLLETVLGNEGLTPESILASVLGFLSTLWSIYVVLAYIVSFVFLYLYIYASIQKSKLAEIQDAQIKADEEIYAMQTGADVKYNRFSELQNHVDSDNPNDWKLAIIEADIILDENLKKQGYAGNSLGERLRSISPASLASLDDAWQAHKVRNQIAHGGPDFVLTHKLARETVMKYERVFRELEII